MYKKMAFGPKRGSGGSGNRGRNRGGNLGGNMEEIGEEIGEAE